MRMRMRIMPSRLRWLLVDVRSAALDRKRQRSIDELSRKLFG